MHEHDPQDESVAGPRPTMSIGAVIGAGLRDRSASGRAALMRRVAGPTGWIVAGITIVVGSLVVYGQLFGVAVSGEIWPGTLAHWTLPAGRGRRRRPSRPRRRRPPTPPPPSRSSFPRLRRPPPHRRHRCRSPRALVLARACPSRLVERHDRTRRTSDDASDGRPRSHGCCGGRRGAASHGPHHGSSGGSHHGPSGGSHHGSPFECVGPDDDPRAGQQFGFGQLRLGELGFRLEQFRLE